MSHVTIRNTATDFRRLQTTSGLDEAAPRMGLRMHAGNSQIEMVAPTREEARDGHFNILRTGLEVRYKCLYVEEGRCFRTAKNESFGLN